MTLETDRLRKVIHDWIREVVPLNVKMTLLPRHVDALIARLSANGENANEQNGDGE